MFMKHIKIFIIFITLVFFGAVATPASASVLGDLQIKLVSLLSQLVTLLTSFRQQNTTDQPIIISPITASTSLSVAPYTIDDVVLIKAKTVIPVFNALDDKYVSDISYSIYLKDGSNRQVTLVGPATLAMKQEAFFKSGYSGDVDKIIAMTVSDSFSVFDISAVSTVTKVITGNDLFKDGVITTYIITIKSGQKYEVKVFAGEQFSTVITKFRTIGYIGDVNKLLEMSEIGFVKSGETIKDIILEGNKNIILVTELSLPKNAIPVELGPVKYGSVSWGDGNTENVFGLVGSGLTQSFSIKHTYKTVGTFVIKITDNSGIVSQQDIFIN